MAWTLLIIAGLLEILWAYLLKQSYGFTRISPSIFTVIAMLASVVLLSGAMRTIPLSTAYMIWTGIGAIGAFLIGALFLSESVSVMKLMAAGFIVLGVVLMKVSAA